MLIDFHRKLVATRARAGFITCPCPRPTKFSISVRSSVLSVSTVSNKTTSYQSGSNDDFDRVIRAGPNPVRIAHNRSGRHAFTPTDECCPGESLQSRDQLTTDRKRRRHRRGHRSTVVQVDRVWTRGVPLRRHRFQPYTNTRAREFNVARVHRQNSIIQIRCDKRWRRNACARTRALVVETQKTRCEPCVRVTIRTRETSYFETKYIYIYIIPCRHAVVPGLCILLHTRV